MVSTKLPLSVIIIASNEEHNLPRCLESVKDFASEIIAVINNCTDATKSILEDYGAIVYEHDWQGFVIQKNRALNYANYSWVLNIDADEEVSPKLKRDIFEIFNKSNENISGFSICRKTMFLGKWITHGDWYPDRVTRLFRKDKAVYDGDYVHEKLVVSGEVVKLSSNLLHYSFPSMYLFLSKNASFTRDFVKANYGKKNFSYSGTIFRAFWKFFRGYFIKMGFLDGYQGFIIAVQQSYSTFFKYNMLLEQDISKCVVSLDPEDE